MIKLIAANANDEKNSWCSNENLLLQQRTAENGAIQQYSYPKRAKEQDTKYIYYNN